ncbi:MAG: trypsin-like serine protease, partial [Elusimicrobia bacterium]|nr:trypsin-like serine protease [Elusimicrobiota bacterium]
MKTRTIVLALIAVTAGVFTYTRPHNPVPSDLRDAVADSSLEQLKEGSGTEASEVNVPESAGNKGFFEDDNRRVTNSSKKPYSLVGRLYKDGKGICAAFLISDQMAMTAAHCVEKNGRYRFGYEGGGPWRRSGAWVTTDIVAISRAKNYVPNSVVGFNIFREDFALLELAKPSSPDWGYFQIADRISEGQAAMVIGFPLVLGGGDYKIISENCSIRKLAIDSIYTDCAINRGNSGGPLLVQGGDGEWLVA